MDFNIIAPSNSNRELFPKNNPSNFRVQLPREIRLAAGKTYEIALMEIQFINSFENVSENNWIKIVIKNHIFIEKIAAGKYDQTSLCDAFNTAIFNRVNALSQSDFDLPPKSVQMKYESKINKFHLVLKLNVKIEFCDEFRFLFGFENSVIEKSSSSTRLPDLKRGFYSMYCYSDIIAPVLVGDVEAPLLRIVSLPNEEGVTSIEFNRPYYMDMRRNTFQTIEFIIRRQDGEDPKFLYGQTNLILNIREKKIE